jgi:hypothetical protein
MDEGRSRTFQHEEGLCDTSGKSCNLFEGAHSAYLVSAMSASYLQPAHGAPILPKSSFWKLDPRTTNVYTVEKV